MLKNTFCLSHKWSQWGEGGGQNQKCVWCTSSLRELPKNGSAYKNPQAQILSLYTCGDFNKQFQWRNLDQSHLIVYFVPYFNVINSATFLHDVLREFSFSTLTLIYITLLVCIWSLKITGLLKKCGKKPSGSGIRLRVSTPQPHKLWWFATRASEIKSCLIETFGMRTWCFFVGC